MIEAMTLDRLKNTILAMTYMTTGTLTAKFADDLAFFLIPMMADRFPLLGEGGLSTWWVTDGITAARAAEAVGNGNISIPLPAWAPAFDGRMYAINMGIPENFMPRIISEWGIFIGDMTATPATMRGTDLLIAAMTATIINGDLRSFDKIEAHMKKWLNSEAAKSISVMDCGIAMRVAYKQLCDGDRLTQMIIPITGAFTRVISRDEYKAIIDAYSEPVDGQTPEETKVFVDPKIAEIIAVMDGAGPDIH